MSKQIKNAKDWQYHTRAKYSINLFLRPKDFIINITKILNYQINKAHIFKVI